MQTLVEDFLQYLRHERGQPAAFWSRRRINAETRRPQRIAERNEPVALGARHLCLFNVQAGWRVLFHPTPPDVRAVKRHKCRAHATTQLHRSRLAGLERTLRFSASSAPPRFSGLSCCVRTLFIRNPPSGEVKFEP